MSAQRVWVSSGTENWNTTAMWASGEGLSRGEYVTVEPSVELYAPAPRRYWSYEVIEAACYLGLAQLGVAVWAVWRATQ